MTAIISRVAIVGGHDGRAEIEVELTYDNGGTTTICLDEEACMASLDRAGVDSLVGLVGKPWDLVLPALEQQQRDRQHFNQTQHEQQQVQQQQHEQQLHESQLQQVGNHA
jgi:response regulator RpfG family c-di-GMP phosphodiesterase